MNLLQRRILLPRPGPGPGRGLLAQWIKVDLRGRVSARAQSSESRVPNR